MWPLVLFAFLFVSFLFVKLVVVSTLKKEQLFKGSFENHICTITMTWPILTPSYDKAILITST